MRLSVTEAELLTIKDALIVADKYYTALAARCRPAEQLLHSRLKRNAEKALELRSTIENGVAA